MQAQTNLYGNVVEGKIIDPQTRMLIRRADEVARLDPEYFADICNRNDVAYRGDFTLLNTLNCLGEVEKFFGFSTENMINALAHYPTMGKIITKKSDMFDDEHEERFLMEESESPEKVRFRLSEVERNKAPSRLFNDKGLEIAYNVIL